MMRWTAAVISIMLIGEGKMGTDHIHWMGQSAFRIEDGAVQIYIDPFKLPENLPKADIIFITHGHYDHFSLDDIAKIKTNRTIFIAPATVAKGLKGNIIEVEPGKTYNAGNLKVTTIPAYNMNKKFHPKKNHWVGYIITLSNGQRIYHAGDTDFIPEMKSIMTDIALMPCDGTYTMDPEEMAQAANTFMPKVLIPMHYGEGLGSVDSGDEVKRLFKGETLILRPER
jgi:L-ascorbate metabolism protein UlaG (beta-lactamase superfamily)